MLSQHERAFRLGCAKTRLKDSHESFGEEDVSFVDEIWETHSYKIC